MKKTLGGDRIGSGGKMTFDTKTFNRSTHNLSQIFRTTIASGTLVPFLVLPTLPGDTMDIDLDAFVHTLPTVGPLFGSYKLQLDVYQIPMRLYMRDLQMNKLEIGRDMSKVQLPIMSISSNNISVSVQTEYSTETPWGGKELQNCQIEPSTILSYLGIKGLGNSDASQLTVTRDFQGMTWLMYWDIVKQYYTNKMEEYGYYIHNTGVTQNELADLDTRVVSNETQRYMVLGIRTDITLNKDITFIISFANSKKFEQWIPETFEAKILNIDQNKEVTAKFQDFDMQINRNTLEYYYTLINDDYRPITPTACKLTMYNSVTYDFERPNLEKYLLTNIDEMREKIMTANGDIPFKVHEASENLPPYNGIFKTVTHPDDPFYTFASLQSKQEGLAIKTYQSDVNNNWLNTEWIEGENGVNAVTSIEADENGKFTLDQFNIKKKVYEMLNHIVASGGTYDDWQDIVWGVQRQRQIASPVYEGGLSKEIVFDQVVSNSASEDGQPLGTLAGRGTLSPKHKGGKMVVKCTEPSMIIGIVSITPRIDYSSGNEWFNNIKNMNEWHTPYLDAIGYQDLITDTIAFWDTQVTENRNPIFKTGGKQPAWINYQTAVNKVYGNFALEGEQMFMVLNRRYEATYDGENYNLSDLTTYVDPTKFNHIFADTSADAMNFWLQIGIDITARRVMSANQIPNL